MAFASHVERDFTMQESSATAKQQFIGPQSSSFSHSADCFEGKGGGCAVSVTGACRFLQLVATSMQKTKIAPSGTVMIRGFEHRTSLMIREVSHETSYRTCCCQSASRESPVAQAKIATTRVSPCPH